VLSHVDLKAGEVVDVPGITRDLAFFNKTGVARIQALMQPGAQFGLTDVELAVTEPPKNLVQLFVDNQGVPSVGQLETGVLLQHYGMLGFDDKLTLYAVKSEGNINGNFGYNVAVDPWGGRIGLSFTRGEIHVVSGPYRSLGVTGDSQVASVNASQPLFGNSEWLFLVNGAVSHNVSSSDQTEVRITGDHTTLETAGVTLGYTGTSLSASISPTVSAAQSYSDVSGLKENFALQSGTFTRCYNCLTGSTRHWAAPGNGRRRNCCPATNCSRSGADDCSRLPGRRGGRTRRILRQSRIAPPIGRLGHKPRRLRLL